MRRYRITTRDVALLEWVGRQRFATSRQVARRFSLDESTSRSRMTALHSLGLLDYRRILHQQPGVYHTTRSGLGMARLELPPASVDLRSYDHDLRVVDFVVASETDGSTVTTEREARHRDGFKCSEPHYSVDLAGSLAARPRLHFPDLIIEGRGPRTAVEVELTQKTDARLRSILSAYGWARHFDAVDYHVLFTGLGKRISSIAREVGVGDRVRVVRDA